MFCLLVMFVIGIKISDKIKWNEATMNRLVGTHRLMDMISNGANPTEIFASWEKELADFSEMSLKYAIY